MPPDAVCHRIDDLEKIKYPEKISVDVCHRIDDLEKT